MLFSLSIDQSQRAAVRLADYYRQFHSTGITKGGGRRKPKQERYMRQVASVKWFDPVKGFGFVVLEDGRDALLHSNAVKAYDPMAVTVLKGSIVECDVTDGAKGLHVTAVSSITAPVMQEGYVPGKVKWFNTIKGFGFVTVDGVDAFIHAEVVKAACMPDLLPDQNVLVLLIDADLGKKVSDVRPA